MLFTLAAVVEDMLSRPTQMFGLLSLQIPGRLDLGKVVPSPAGGRNSESSGIAKQLEDIRIYHKITLIIEIESKKF